MVDCPSHFARTDERTAQRAVMGDGHREFLHFMLEHICLCVVKEHLDGDGQGGKLNSFPLLKALLLYTRQDDLEGKPQLKKLLHVAVMVCHVYLATQKSSSDEFRKKHLDALVVCMDSKLDASHPNLPQSVVAKAKCCAVALTLAVHGYKKAWELAEEYCKDQSMARYRRELMQALRSLKKGDTSVECVLEAFSMANFLEEFDSTVEELYNEFAPSVVEKVCEQLGMEKVLLSDPLAMLSRTDMAAPTHTWEGFEAAVERMARGRDVSGKGKRKGGNVRDESFCEKKGDEKVEEEEEETKQKSRKSDQRTNLKGRRQYLLRRPKAPVSYVDLSTSSSEEEEDLEEGHEGEEIEDVPQEVGRQVHRELRTPEESGVTKPLSAAGSGKEGRQTRQSPRKPEASKRKVESEEEDMEEEESRQDGMKPAAKNMSQQLKRGGRPRGRPPLGSAGREDPSPIARRMPRKRGQKLTVTEFVKQLQGKGQTEKRTKKKELKLARRALDPCVMSGSEENDESDSNTSASETSSPSMATRSSVRGNSMEAASVLSRRRRGRPASNMASGDLATLVVEMDSLDSQSSDRRRKVTPEVKTRVTRQSTSSRRQKVAGSVVNLHVMSSSEEESDASNATDPESDAADALRRSPRKHSATTLIRVSPRKHQRNAIAAAEENETEDAEYKQQRKVPRTQAKESSNRVSETSGTSMGTRSSVRGNSMVAASVLSRKRRGRPVSNKASGALATQPSVMRSITPIKVENGVTQIKRNASSRKQEVVGSVVDPRVMSSSKEESDASSATDTESDAADTLRRSPRKHSATTTQIHVSPRKHQRNAIAAAEEDEEEDAEHKQQRMVPRTRSKESSNRVSETSGTSMATRSSVRGNSMEAASMLSRKRRGRPASNKASGDLATVVVEVDSADLQSSGKRGKLTPEMKKGVTYIRQSASSRRQYVIGSVVNPHVMSSSKEESDASNVTDTESDAADALWRSPRKHSATTTQIRVSPRKHQRNAIAAAEENEEEDAEYKQQRMVPRTRSKESSNRVSETSGTSMATRSSVHGSSMEAASVLSRKRRGRPASNKASGGLATVVVEVDSADLQSSGKRGKLTPEVKKGVTHIRQSASSRRQYVVGSVVNPHVMSSSEEGDASNATDTESDATDSESDASDALRRSPRKHSTATTQIRVSPRKHQRIAVAAAEEDEEEDAECKQQRMVPRTRPKESSNRVSETSGPSMATRSSVHGSSMEAASMLSRKRRGRPASNKASGDLATQSSVMRSITPTKVENGVTQIKRNASPRRQEVTGSVVDPRVMSSSEEESDASSATDTESDAVDALRRSPRKHSATTQIRVSPRKHQRNAIAAAEENEEEDAEYKQQHMMPRTRSKESSNRVSETSGPSMTTRSSVHGSNMEVDLVLSRKRRGRPASNKASGDLAAVMVEIDSLDSQSSGKRRKVSPEVKKGVTHITRSASSRRQKVVGSVVDPRVMSSSEESDASNVTDTESDVAHVPRRSPRKYSAATTQTRISPRKHQKIAIARTEEDKERLSYPRRGRPASGKHSAGKGKRRMVTPEVWKGVTRISAF